MIILDKKSDITFDEINELTKSVGWGDAYFDSSQQWQHTLAMSAHVGYIRDNNKVIAFGRLVEDGKMCMFYDICIHADYQKQGLGLRLMNHLIDKIKDKNYISIGLFVWDGNKTVTEFYRKLGFEPVVAMELKGLMKQV